MKNIFSSISLFLIIPIMLFNLRAQEALPYILDTVGRVVFCTLLPCGVLVRLFITSPAARYLSFFLSKTPLWRASGLSASFAPGIIAGTLAGFPMGAIAVSSDKSKSAPKALALSSIASPAFLAAVLPTPLEGIFLYTILVLSLWCILLPIPCPKCRANPPPRHTVSFAEALSEGASSAVGVAGAIIFVSVILALLPDSLSKTAREFIFALSEIGTAASFCKNPAALSLALSFGGLCAWAQIDFSSKGVDTGLYLFSRLFLFFPTLLFFLCPKLRIFELIFLILLLVFEISVINSCKKRK